LRYPGQRLAPGEVIPLAVSAFPSAHLGIIGDRLVRYVVGRQTHQQHNIAIWAGFAYIAFVIDACACAKRILSA